MSCVTSHCQERFILLHFVPVVSNLHFSLVKHLVPCVTIKDRFPFFWDLFFCCTLPFPLVLPNPSSFPAGIQTVPLCVPTFFFIFWAEWTKRRHVPCGYTYISQDRTHEGQSVWILHWRTKEVMAAALVDVGGGKMKTCEGMRSHP